MITAGAAYGSDRFDAAHASQTVGGDSGNSGGSMADYYSDCYRQMTANAQGSYVFYNVIEGEALLQEWRAAYQAEGYMEEAVTALDASACDMRLEMQNCNRTDNL